MISSSGGRSQTNEVIGYYGSYTLVLEKGLYCFQMKSRADRNLKKGFFIMSLPKLVASSLLDIVHSHMANIT